MNAVGSRFYVSCMHDPTIPFRTSAMTQYGRPADAQAFLHDPVGCMMRLYRNYGRSVMFEREGVPFLFAFGPEFNARLFGDMESFHIVSRFPGPKRSAQRRFGRGMFSMNGDEHREARRRLMPPFEKKALAAYVQPLGEIIGELVGSWRVGQSLDLLEQMKELTLRISARILFGVDDGVLAHSIEHLFEDWLDLNHLVSFSAHLPVEAPEGCYERLLDIAVRLERELQALVNGKRLQLRGVPSVFDVMLQARAAGAMDDEELIGQTITLFNAAYHTTTYALTWAHFLMIQHPSVMRRVDAELQSLPGDELPTVDELSRLPVLDHAIKESLRLLPSVVYLPRIATHALTLGPHQVPAGTMIIASPYMSHHLPDVFPEPERFLPDRWSKSPAPWGYIPFGAGARLCLGAPLATIIIKLTMQQVFRRFRLQVVPGANIERHGTLSLGAKHGVPVMLHPADGAFTASPVVGSIHEMVDLVETPETRKLAA